VASRHRGLKFNGPSKPRAASIQVGVTAPEDLLAERGIDISHETVRFWWNRFGPMFAAEIRKRRVAQMRGYPQWRWHLDEGVPRRLPQ
jgi:transposase-like protein